MVETPSVARRSSRRQSSFPPESSQSEHESTASGTDNTSRPRSSRFRTPQPEEEEQKDEMAQETGVKARINGQANGHTNGHANGHANGFTNGSTTPQKDSSTKKDEPATVHAIDGWIPGQDPKVDHSGEFEFGGSFGTLALMILFPVLMWYMWIGATYYDGKVPSRAPNQTWLEFGSHLVNLVYTGAFPHTKAWLWYWSYLIFEGACYCLLPGVWGYGKPLPHEGGKQLRYYCNGFVSLYFTLAILAVLHFTGIWPIYTAVDEFGPLLSVAIFSGFLVSFVAYFSAIWRGKQHRMTGYPIYDFFMGAELNPRMFGILDFKMFFEVRMPWYILLILSLGTAARQWENYGYVSGEAMFLVMAHYLYANACAKGEELIITTW